MNLYNNDVPMMKSKFIALLFIGSLLPLSVVAQNGSKTPSLDEITSGQFYARGAGYGMRSMADGLHYTSISTDGTALLRYSFATGKLVDTLFSTNKARDCEFTTFDDYQISPNGHHILVYTDTESIYRRSTKSHVYHYDVRRNRVEPLSETLGKVMIPTFSPDGRMVAFVREGDIFIKKFDFDTEVRVTSDAKFNSVMNGITDWVYEEEFTTTSLMSWSEDSQSLAFVRTDESAVPQYGMTMYRNELYPQDYTYKYPKAGEPNSIVTVHLYDVASRKLKDLPLPKENRYYIPRIEFTGRDGNLAIMTLNRRQDHFRMYYANYKTMLPKLVFEERSNTYIDSEHIQGLKFTPSGFAYVSERSGYAHLYLFSDRGQLQRTLTSGKWDITSFYGVDPNGTAYYQAADEHPSRRSIYSVDTKGRRVRLGAHGGLNDAIFSSNYTYFIGSHSDLTTPLATAVYRTKDNREVRMLENNSALSKRLEDYSFAKKELISLQLQDGTVLNGWELRPKDFDPNKKYPLLMTQYSGPNSQQVLDRYSFGWEYYLASKGIIVICVDGRGTGARGEAWRKGTYLRLGVQESADQIAAAKALAQRPYIDGTRIGIWGWSFGGYNTLMSLCHGAGTFKLGIAVAPVTDWRYYDTIYTERFMRTPKENPEGYKSSSVLEAAHQLQGRLLLIHGSADDNVHLQNSMELISRLVEANKPFDMAVYTDKDHSIRGGKTSLHLYSKMAQYLIDHL